MFLDAIFHDRCGKDCFIVHSRWSFVCYVHIVDRYLKRIKAGDGEVIIKEGDDAYHAMKFYFVESGECQAVKTHEGKDVIIGTMKVGSYFGEKALIERQPRACNVVAVGTTTCAALDVAAFERIMGPLREDMKDTISVGVERRQKT